jgi:hypothetical protein
MHQRPQQILRQLIRHYGVPLHTNPRRVEALLQDLCGQYPREIFVLVHAQEMQIPQALLGGGASAQDPAQWQRLSRRLQDRLAFTPEAADWAVQSWALALDVTPARYRYPRPIRFLLDRWDQINLAPLGQGITSFFNSQRRSFAESGVQWEQPRRWFEKQWFERRWFERQRWMAPTLLALLCIGIIAVLAQPAPTAVLGRHLIFWQTEDAEEDSALPTAQIAGWLDQLYPLPRAVRIGEEPVAVHVEPAFETQILALLTPAGATVIVDAYTADGRWAHISDPIAGWIEQDGVTQILPAEEGPAEPPIFIMPMMGWITGDGVRVRQTPTLDSTILRELQAGEQVLVLAATQDRAWFQIVEPIQGWVSADYIAEDMP